MLIMLGWVFFRANSIGDAFLSFQKMATEHGMLYNGEGKPAITLPIMLILLLIAKEIKDEYGLNLHLMSHKNLYVSAFWTAVMVIVILLCARFESGQFIYFQF